MHDDRSLGMHLFTLRELCTNLAEPSDLSAVLTGHTHLGTPSLFMLTGAMAPWSMSPLMATHARSLSPASDGGLRFLKNFCGSEPRGTECPLSIEFITASNISVFSPWRYLSLLLHRLALPLTLAARSCGTKPKCA